MFPSNWPEGCPPADAVAAQGSVFRVVRSNPPDPADFMSLLEQGRPVVGRLCESAGLSVFKELHDAVHYTKKYPYLGELIAEGKLENRHGAMKATSRRGNSHTTWWPSAGTARHDAFAVVGS
jgi:hypothetical protein